MASLCVDGYLKSNLDIILNDAIPNNWDMVGLITGIEGSGKSTHATQCILHLDPNHTLKHCVFTPQQFIEAIDTCEPESGILWDEAITGANIEQHAKDIQQVVKMKLVQIRKKKLKLLLCIPYLRMFDKYFIGRCQFNIHVYAKGFNDRGYALFYSANKLEYLYNLMKERYRYNPSLAYKRVKANFYYKFNNFFPYDVKEYDNKKESSRISNEQKSKPKVEQHFINLIKHLLDKDILNQKQIANAIGVTQPFISQYYNKL